MLHIVFIKTHVSPFCFLLSSNTEIVDVQNLLFDRKQREITHSRNTMNSLLIIMT